MPQYAAISALPHRRDYPVGSGALAFLRETIRGRPGEITLLAVGPMTNIGALFASDPGCEGVAKEGVGAGRFPRPERRDQEGSIGDVFNRSHRVSPIEPA